MWNFYMNDSQLNSWYDMILGRDVYPNPEYIYVSLIILLGKMEARKSM